jgi:Domain of unknown function (DUF4124)
MKYLLTATAVCLLSTATGSAESVWRWTDANGTLHYSNQRALAPAAAETVSSVITGSRAAQRLPRVGDEDTYAPRADTAASDRAPSDPRPVERRLHRIYDEERMRFGCYTGGVLFFGGWAHADDISSSIACSRYLLGPEAWLNTARAELAVRQNGISARELYRMYRADRSAGAR